MPSLLNNVLRAIRIRYRPELTSAGAAKQLGVIKSQMHKLERGGLKQPTDAALMQMLDLYGCQQQIRMLVVAVRDFVRDGLDAEDSTEAFHARKGVELAARAVEGNRWIVTSPWSYTELFRLRERLAHAVLTAPALLGVLMDTVASPINRDPEKLFEVIRHALTNTCGLDDRLPEGPIFRILPAAKSLAKGYSDTFCVDGILLASLASFGYVFTAHEGVVEVFRKDLELFEAMAYTPKEAVEFAEQSWQAVKLLMD